MDIRNLCNSSRSIRLGRSREEGDDQGSNNKQQQQQQMWRALWLKLKREHKRIFVPSRFEEFPYDESTYLQNFDRGHAKDEPENLSRSFSVKYAKSSRKISKS